jgi:hypothetical protein
LPQPYRQAIDIWRDIVRDDVSAGNHLVDDIGQEFLPLTFWEPRATVERTADIRHFNELPILPSKVPGSTFVGKSRLRSMSRAAMQGK